MEALLGVRGAAWLGGIALAVAGLLTVKYSVENNLVSPQIRIASLLLFGAGALVVGDVWLRKRYAVTANAMCAAGIAMLYSGFVAAHGVYHLLPLAATFAFMVLVTGLACLLSLRRDSVFIALLGMLGGFATPIVLSSGNDAPVGLFAYILLLDIGLLFIAAKRGWRRLIWLSLGATVFIEGAWFSEHGSPEKMAIACGAFTLLSLVYLAVPDVTARLKRRWLTPALIGGLAPFAFALYFAGTPSYAVKWPLLFGFIACLDAAFLVLLIFRGRAVLFASGAIATLLTVTMWMSDHLSMDNQWGAGLTSLALGAFFVVGPRLRTRFGRGESDGPAAAGAIIAEVMLGMVATMIAVSRGDPPWLFTLYSLALVVAVWERSPGWAATLGPLAISLISSVWFINNATPDHLLRDFALLLWIPALFSVVATRRPLLMPLQHHPELGAVFSLSGVVVSLSYAISDNTGIGGDPRPIFVVASIALVLLVLLVLRTQWTKLLLVGLGIMALFALAWESSYFAPTDIVFALSFFVAWMLIFFALPLVLNDSWRERQSGFYASALAAPLFFLPIYDAVTKTWGKAYIGILPVLLAALALIGLARVLAQFEDLRGSRARLRNISLYGAVVLGFIGAAIPLQFERQWITLGWALQALGVWWLFRKLAHPGLKYFGFALYTAVAIRLLLNDQVLHYHPRGAPVLNWILYTYAISAMSALIGMWWMVKIERERLEAWEKPFWSRQKFTLSAVVAVYGLLLLFALINLEIADYFSSGEYVELSWQHQSARDLTTSVAWIGYALVLLGIGTWRKLRSLRFASLGLMIASIGKVFLYDLANLQGLYRVLSFVGLAFALILVSLIYQRFVFRKEGT